MLLLVLYSFRVTRFQSVTTVDLTADQFSKKYANGNTKFSVELKDGSLSVPLAFSTVRETDSIIKAKSGQVVVIGGLMQNKKTNTESGIPYLRDIPYIGAIFGQTRESIVQSELVILIQPKVVDSNFHHEEMDRINERFSGLKQGRKL